MRFTARALVVLVVIVLVLLGPPPPPGFAAVIAGGGGAGPLRPPVDAPVSEPFRAPATPYGPGHRGLEYGTTPGVVVRAAGPGVVAFAGVVAGRRFVAVEHPGGLRSAVGPLARLDVPAGAVVAAGTPLGTTAGPLLFTVRRAGVYIDPAPLLGDGPPAVRLVPDPLGASGAARARARPHRPHPMPWLLPRLGR
jgi:murein DD-endopeptidase MepM/ murein hydrolase activator NlpD